MSDFEKYDINSDGSRGNNSDLNQNQNSDQSQNRDQNQNSNQSQNSDLNYSNNQSQNNDLSYTNNQSQNNNLSYSNNQSQNNNLNYSNNQSQNNNLNYSNNQSQSDNQNQSNDQSQNSKLDHNVSQNQNNKVPEYSFWAEQLPTDLNRNNSQGVNNLSGQNRPYYYSAEYNSPEYNRPNYDGPNYGRPNSNEPDYNRPNYNRPNYNRPDYGRVDYNRPYTGGNSSPYQMNGENRNNYDNGRKSEGSKSGGKVLRFITKAACFGLIAGLSFYGLSQLYYTINPEAAKYRAAGYGTGNQDDREAEYKIGFTETGDIKVEDQSKISQVTDATIPAIVSISSISTQTQNWFGVPYDQQSEGSGSGIIVGKDEDELLIATNNHVVAGTDKIKVTFQDGKEAEAVIKGADAKADLAVVTVDLSTLSEETLNAISIAKLGNSDDIKVGEMSIAIGNALGYGQSITVGYISAKDREVEVSDGYSKKKMILLQTDAAINPGNSGGALLNVEGEVIGINTIKYADYGVEGMGFAIPISLATPIINELMNREILAANEQGYLGIVGTDVTEEAASFYNLPMGVFVDSLQEGGPAAKAGLREDDIITHADELEITAITQLRDYVTSLRVGTEVEITYMRNTDGVFEEGKVTVVLGPNPQLSVQ